MGAEVVRRHGDSIALQIGRGRHQDPFGDGELANDETGVLHRAVPDGDIDVVGWDPVQRIIGEQGDANPGMKMHEVRDPT